MKKHFMATIAGLLAITFTVAYAADAEQEIANGIHLQYGSGLPCDTPMKVSGSNGKATVVIGDLNCRTDAEGNIMAPRKSAGATVYVWSYDLMSNSRQIMKLNPQEAYTSGVVQPDDTVTLQFSVQNEGAQALIFEPVIVYENGTRHWIGPTSDYEYQFKQMHGGIKGPGDKGGHYGTAFVFKDGALYEGKLSAHNAMLLCLATPSNDSSMNIRSRCAEENQPQFAPEAVHTEVTGPENMSPSGTPSVDNLVEQVPPAGSAAALANQK